MVVNIGFYQRLNFLVFSPERELEGHFRNDKELALMSRHACAISFVAPALRSSFPVSIQLLNN